MARRTHTGVTVAIVAVVFGLSYLLFSRHGAPSRVDVVPPRAGAPPTIVLLVVDTLRADRLASYGFSGHATPNMDRVAARGVRFAEAHSPAPWTRPAMAAIFTSRHPGELGMVEVPPPDPTVPWPTRARRDQRTDAILAGVPTMAERMRGGGYRTVAFVNQPALHVSTSYRRGFDEVFHPARVGEVALATDADTEQRWADVARAYENDRALIARADAWLAEARGPAFLWVHLMTPHAPYRPPRRFVHEEVVHEGVVREGGVREVSDSDPSVRDVALYEAEVRATDALVGELLESLEARRGLDNVLFILTSDHGEELGDHGAWEHGHTLHREVIRVPLMMFGPGLPVGRVVDARVGTIDLLPTLLSLIGAAVAEDEELRGVSLLPAIHGHAEPRTLLAEAMLYGPTQRSLVQGSYRIIQEPGTARDALYDVRSDPDEMRDLAPSASARTAQLREALQQFREREDRPLVPETSAAPVDPTLERALQALGYIDHPTAEPPAPSQ